MSKYLQCTKGRKPVDLHRPVQLAMLKNEMAGRLHINRKPELQSEVKSIQTNKRDLLKNKTKNDYLLGLALTLW